MANGIKTPFTVDAARAKEFLQQSADSKACESLMDKARLHIPDFYNKRVRRGGNESHKQTACGHCTVRRNRKLI
jgi:hypothetical protein|nr:MAG TPA: hypothetical protein [Caudoviricetes sp.]